MDTTIWITSGKALINEIQTYQQLEVRNDLLQEVVAQLNKDFGSNLIDIQWDSDKHNPYHDFIFQVKRELGRLLKSEKSTLMSILYRVDVFESKLRVVWTLDHEDQIKKLTELILNRELQKVLTRKLHNQK
ncbi:MAG: hypothetical protein ACI9JN_001009 [Bacteroidia bacterium]